MKNSHLDLIREQFTRTAELYARTGVASRRPDSGSPETLQAEDHVGLLGEVSAAEAGVGLLEPEDLER